MDNSKQQSFGKSRNIHRYSHGGVLRNQRAGRNARPVRPYFPIHLVLKTNRECIKGGLRTPRRFLLIHRLRDRYAKRFFIKIEQMAVQGDHVHIIVRTTRRSALQNFLRVFSGQIAQQFERDGLAKTMVTDTQRAERKIKFWKHRPFTRLVLGRRAFATLQDYVQLNEKEAQGVIPYRKERLRGLTDYERRVLLWK